MATVLEEDAPAQAREVISNPGWILAALTKAYFRVWSSVVLEMPLCENQDGGVGRHTAPPCTTRTDRKSNGKKVQHQGDKNINIHPDP